MTIDADRSDADLIARSVREPEAFSTVFDRHFAELLRYVHARLGPDTAEDVTSETFLAAFRHRSRYDHAWPDARPWLYGIASRQIGKHRRAELRWLRILATAPPDGPPEDFGDRSAERVAAERLRPALVALLSAMKPQDRELLLLVAWAGLSYQEAGAALGLTPGAVKSRLHRILVRTRTELGGADPMDRELGVE